LIPNHVSFLDGIVIFALTGAIPVAKIEVRDTPIVGRILDAMGTIWVQRSTGAGRKGALHQIRDYQSSQRTIGRTPKRGENCADRFWLTEKTPRPPLMIFPEGTTSNMLTLTQFKTGAFGGLPVQPVLLHYTNRLADCSFLSSQAFTALHLGCQFINFVSITYMEPYTPDENERRDHVLFAQNVRAAMAGRLGAVMTKHSFEDVLLKKLAEKKGSNASQFETMLVDEVYRKFDLKAGTVLKLGKAFVAMADKSGTVDFESFRQICGFSTDPAEGAGAASRLFDLLLEASGETVDFHEDTVGGSKFDGVDGLQLHTHAASTSPTGSAAEDARHSEFLKISGTSVGKSAAGTLRAVKTPDVKLSRRLSFEHFMVLVAVCYNPSLEDDAFQIFFALCDSEYRLRIEVDDLRRPIRRVNEKAERTESKSLAQYLCGAEGESDELDENKAKVEAFYEAALKYASDDTRSVAEDDEEKRLTVNFEGFVQGLREKELLHLVQKILQWIFFVTMGFSLDYKTDFKQPR
jgi:hypothetical protein